ncbi:MAG: hypothetical protein WBB82_13815 [Limnothrix sp.]
MFKRTPLYNPQEFAERGARLYESRVRPKMEAEDYGRFAAIDLETGIFEIADDILSATTQLFHHEPEAQPWVVRIGEQVICRIGARSLKEST